VLTNSLVGTLRRDAKERILNKNLDGAPKPRYRSSEVEICIVEKSKVRVVFQQKLLKALQQRGVSRIRPGVCSTSNLRGTWTTSARQAHSESKDVGAPSWGNQGYGWSNVVQAPPERRPALRRT